MLRYRYINSRGDIQLRYYGFVKIPVYLGLLCMILYHLDAWTMRQTIRKFQIVHQFHLPCYAVIACNVVVFLSWQYNDRVLMQNYFLINPDNIRKRPICILLSSFSHENIIHLGYNLLSLYRLLPEVQALVGLQSTCIVFVAGSIASSCMSVYKNDRSTSSQGASGAAYTMIMFQFIFEDDSCLDAVIAVGNYFLHSVCVNHFLPEIDHWAHLGGCICGCLIGIVIRYDTPTVLQIFSDVIAI